MIPVDLAINVSIEEATSNPRRGGEVAYCREGLQRRDATVLQDNSQETRVSQDGSMVHSLQLADLDIDALLLPRRTKALRTVRVTLRTVKSCTVCE